MKKMTLRPGTLWGKKQGMRMIHKLPIWITANGSEHEMRICHSLESLAIFFLFVFSASLRYNQQRKL